MKLIISHNWRLAALLLLLGAVGCSGGHGGPAAAAEEADPAEVAAGERLFLETRFAQFFMANSGGDANATLPMGDPALDFTETTTGPLPGPFAGQSMNCAACHLVDQQLEEVGGGMRAYTDFARRSPIPMRSDGATLTARNSPPLAGASVDRANPFITHLDGEFADLVELVRATLTGRNYGWLPTEAATAIAHVASIIRNDDGTGDLAAEFGALSYWQVLDVNATGVPEEFDLPVQFKLDLATATDQQIFDVVAALVAEYVAQLEFIGDDDGEFDGSPYDLFLDLNNLPRVPDPGESREDYATRLLGLFDALAAPVWVSAGNGAPFAFHDQDFTFGADELEGAKLFFRRPPPGMMPGGLPPNGIGNCVSCHHAPEFNDFGFHAIGTAQEEYDSVHGPGAFAQLAIPDLPTRDMTPDAFLPAMPSRPNGQGPFRAIPTPLDPQQTDLGVWNIFANDAVPLPQTAIRDILVTQAGLPVTATDDDVLTVAVAAFRTLGLRDLGHSAPYMHTGRFDTLDDVLSHYINFSALARNGQVRNADPELMRISITPTEAVSLIAFLRALNEDYE